MGDDMTIAEARELLQSPIWPMVRDRFLATGNFIVYPKGDARRIEYLDESVRADIALWREAILKAEDWRKIVDGAKIREIKASYPGVYPAVFRYTMYFKKWIDGAPIDDAFTLKLLKIKFPEAYALCYS